MDFYKEEIGPLYKKFNSSSLGLTTKRANISLAHHGKNELTQKKKINPLVIFLSQFKSFIIYILLLALFISLALGYINEDPQDKYDSYVDAFVIFVILFLNALLGFIQEYRAEKSIEALKKLAGLKATVIRDGKTQDIDASLLVPGDVIILETGDKVPADARMIEAINLETQEAPLTGESMPVAKISNVIDKTVGVAERKNMVYSGTIITRGRGKALVCATGMHTELGKIARLIQEQDSMITPLQQKLEQLGKMVGYIVLGIVFIVFLSGIFRGVAINDMFMAAVALAVAAVPEGLPAVVTISLALGVQRMIKKNALIRNLPSVETLGSTTVICSDKTGTLTKNEMTVKEVYVNNEIVEVSGSGYSLDGRFSKDPKHFEMLLKCGALCNDALLDGTVIGDPTEGALIVSAGKAGLRKEDLSKKYPRVNEIPFDSERKMMSTIHSDGEKKIMFTKGAPENVLKCCNSVLVNGRIEKLDDSIIQSILRNNIILANKALRVLGFAYRESAGDISKEEGLVFLGLQAMMDPPREEAKQAVEKCKSAGIRVVMITGDHKDTAVAIANELGIIGKAMTGDELEKITNLEKIVDEIGVYARVNPEHKLKIVQALQARGHVVAMTGDGVNDAPALKKADIGIAMGITGTDVAREASQMVLTDDNFASIVNAVEEGRGIYDNIKKFVFYLVSSNLGEVLAVFMAILIGAYSADGVLIVPLIAIQILWINLLTDGLPALALGVDKADTDIMTRKPRPKGENIINSYNMAVMSGVAVIMMVVTLMMFFNYDPAVNTRYAQTIAFTSLVMLQMFNVFNATSEYQSFFKKGLFENPYLILAIAMSLILQAVIMYTPFFASIFKVVPLALADWGLIALMSSSVLLFGETIKLIKRRIYDNGELKWLN
ncbi:MAG: calcium-translocating P-type ATPase, SERCA-type [Candidatus Woesearchaeota archaeon]